MNEFFIRYEVKASKKNPSYRVVDNSIKKIRDIKEGKSHVIFGDCQYISPRMPDVIERIKEKHDCEENEIDIININKI